MYNVIARVGLDGDVLGEYSKAMSTLNGMQSYTEMNPPIPQGLPPEQSLEGDTAPMTPTEEITP